MDADILNAKQNVIYPLAIVIFSPDLGLWWNQAVGP